MNAMYPLEEAIWYEVNFQYSRMMLSRIHHHIADDDLYERKQFATHWNKRALWSLANAADS